MDHFLQLLQQQVVLMDKVMVLVEVLQDKAFLLLMVAHRLQVDQVDH